MYTQCQFVDTEITVEECIIQIKGVAYGFIGNVHNTASLPVKSSCGVF